MSKQKFYVCSHCGNIAALVIDKGAPLSCCGEKMLALIPNTVDASQEKHVPVVTKTGNTISVKVGSIPHPMEEKHYIMFIYVETKNGGQKKRLNAGEKPEAEFSFINDEPVAVYEYCNIHGLWKTEL